LPYVSKSKIHGLGVFADKDYSVGETIELCPYLVSSKNDIGDDHSETPNAEWDVNEEDDNFIRFYALQDIAKGQEILHDYGTSYWSSREAA